MADQQQAEWNEPHPQLERGPQAPSEGMGGCAQAAIGFGIFVVILLLIGLAGAYWVVQNARGIAANMVTPAIQQVVSQMKIPPAQEKQISRRINKLAEDFKNQEISVEQLTAILAGVGESAIAVGAMTLWFADEYIGKSGLTADEKADATLIAKRFANGLLDKKINGQKANEVMDMISDETPDGQTSIKQTLTDKELRDVLVKMKTDADAAGVPAEVPEINFAKEFDKVVDKVLDGKSNSSDPTLDAEPNPSTSDRGSPADSRTVPAGSI